MKVIIKHKVNDCETGSARAKEKFELDDADLGIVLQFLRSMQSGDRNKIRSCAAKLTELANSWMPF